MAIRKLRLLSKVPRHSEQLQISTDSRKIEEELNLKLISLVRQIQKLQMEQTDTFYSLDFRQRIDSTFRSGIEQIYKIAAAYAANFTQRDYFTTRADLDTISRLTQSYTSIFYSRLQRFIININPQETQGTIRPEFIVNMTTATMTQDVMRQAIITKSQQVLNPVAITTAAVAADTEILDRLQNPVVYVWVTSRDDRVCPICSGYEGQAWAFEDSADIPDIPEDSHPNCRCIIQLAEAEFMQ